MLFQRKNWVAKISQRLQRYFHVSAYDILRYLASGFSIIFVFSMSVCLFFSHSTMKHICMYSVSEIEVTDIMALNAESYGSTGEILRDILNDVRVRDMMGEILAEKVDALLMRGDIFTTKEQMYSLLECIVQEKEPELTNEQVNSYVDYIYLISGASHSIEVNGSALEYRFSYYVLQEDVTNENKSEIEEAYNIVSALTNIQLPILMFFFWAILIFCTIFLGRNFIIEALWRLFRSHITALIIVSAIPISSLITGRVTLGIFGKAAMYCFLISICLMFIFECITGVPALYVLKHKFWKDTASKKLELIRHPYATKKKDTVSETISK